MRLHLHVYAGDQKLGQIDVDYIGPETDPSKVAQEVRELLERNGVPIKDVHLVPRAA